MGRLFLHVIRVPCLIWSLLPYQSSLQLCLAFLDYNIVRHSVTSAQWTLFMYIIDHIY